MSVSEQCHSDFIGEMVEAGHSQVGCQVDLQAFLTGGLQRGTGCQGKRKGQKRRDELLPKVLEMKSQGASIRQISKVFDVPKSTISEWVSGSHIR